MSSPVSTTNAMTTTNTSVTPSSPTTPLSSLIGHRSGHASRFSTPPGFRQPHSTIGITVEFPTPQLSIPASLFPSSYMDSAFSSTQPHFHVGLSQGLISQPPFGVLSNSSYSNNIFGPLPPTPLAINVTNFVIIPLASVEDYLPWKALFTGFLVSQQLSGLVDGSTPMPSPHITDATGQHRANPDYMSWLRFDQTIRTCLFATLSRDVLLEVYDLPHSKQI
ncbi:hypothetical protein vseg_001782 [Gypsophila vaccaria]